MTIVETCLNFRSDFHLVGRVKKLITAIQRKLWSLNLFESEVAEENVRDLERITTRVFLVALLGCCAIAGFYIFIVRQEQLITVLHPTANEYRSLYQDYSRSLLCPCSQLSVPYAKLLNVTYVLHQVCSSGMVSAEWLDYLISFNPAQINPIFGMECARDFRTFGALYFQLLDTFCSLARETIENEQTVSSSKELISSNVLSLDIYSQQVNATIEAFANTTLSRFTQMLTWIDIDNSANLFLAGTNDNFGVTDYGTSILIDYVYGSPNISATKVLDTCACASSITNYSLALLIYKNMSSVENFVRDFKEIPIGCIPYYGFSRSSIAWWYEKDYIEDIRQTYSDVQSQTAPEVEPLNQSISTRFYNRTMTDLLYAMFVESITEERAAFETFYSECAPRSCSYKIIRRREIFVGLLLLISVCGGLSRGLRLLIPLLTTCIFFCLEKWRNRSNGRSKYQFTLYMKCIFVFLAWNITFPNLRQALQNALVSIRSLNLYKTHSNNQADVHAQLIHTRVYLVALITCLSVLIFYFSVIERSGTETIPFPSPNDFERLLERYPNSVNCPCTHIAIPYGDFLTQFNVTSFHEACSNSTVPNAFSLGDPVEMSSTILNGTFFQAWKGVFASGIGLLCKMTHDYVDRGIRTFRSSPMLTYQMIPRHTFDYEVNATGSRFQSTLPIAFGQTLDLLPSMGKGNALISPFSANWDLVKDNDTLFHSELVIKTRAETGGTCSCLTDKFCSVPTLCFKPGEDPRPGPTGVRFGCTVLDSILESSLSCYYSLSCVNKTRGLMGLNGSVEDWMEQGYTIVLNASLTHFALNASLETLAHELFIESWTSEASYERFFNACAPTYCTGTYYHRFDAFDLLTAFLSVFSGLATLLRFLTPLVVSVFSKIRHRIRPS